MNIYIYVYKNKTIITCVLKLLFIPNGWGFVQQQSESKIFVVIWSVLYFPCHLCDMCHMSKDKKLDQYH